MAMNANAPTCTRCGALSTNPGATACPYCGSPLAQAGYGGGAPSPYGGYGSPQLPPGSPYGQAQAPYGQPQAPYGTWPQQGGYGFPQQTGGYPPPNAYGSPFVPAPPRSSFWTSGWGIYWMIRLGIALVFILIAGLGACFSMLSH